MSYFSLSQNIAVGTFGPMTQQYVVQFQAQNGISQTGTVGPLTRAAILSRCSTTPPGNPSQVFSGTPLTGTTPLTVSFSVPQQNNGATLNFGDGTSQTVAWGCTGGGYGSS